MAIRNFLYCIVPATVFAGIAMVQIELPGLQADEVYYVPPAAALIKGQYDMDYVMLDPSVIHIFDYPIPLMFNYYTGFLRTYLTFPVFVALGIDVYTIRISSIAFSTLALIFFTLFTHRLTRSRVIAFSAGLLLATDASFIAYTHNDFVVVATMMFLKGGALAALLGWWMNPNKKALLYIGTLFFGLGISDRASFLWLLFVLIPILLILYHKNILKELKKRIENRTTLFFAGLSFSAGASLFIAFNIATLGGTFTPMLSTFRNTSSGVDNLAFGENLYLRLQMLTDVLSGEYLSHFIFGEVNYRTSTWNFTGSPMSWLFPVIFFYYSAKCTIDSLAKKRTVDHRMAFLLLFSVGLLIMASFTPTLFRGHQLLMLYPFPHIIVAIGLYELLQFVRKYWVSLTGKLIPVLQVAVIIVISTFALRPVRAYYDELEKTGGRGVWSDAIYEIVAEVDKHPDKTVVCMDWGFNPTILSLTKNKINTIRNVYQGATRTPEGLTKFFDEKHVLLFHSPKYTLRSNVRDDFAAAVALANASIDTLKIFYQRDGDAVAYLLQAKPAEINAN